MRLYAKPYERGLCEDTCNKRLLSRWCLWARQGLATRRLRDAEAAEGKRKLFCPRLTAASFAVPGGTKQLRIVTKEASKCCTLIMCRAGLGDPRASPGLGFLMPPALITQAQYRPCICPRPYEEQKRPLDHQNPQETPQQRRRGMKFGKYLESKQLEFPEYLGHFINYKGLKKLIKQLATVGSNDSPITDYNNRHIEKLLQDNKSIFFFRVERELEKVNEFYIEKQADLKLKLDILVNKKIQLLKYNSLNDKDYTLDKNSSITFQTLYSNFKQFTKKLDQLSQFVELNETGFRKILKKWDKRSKSHLKEIYLSTTINAQPVFHREEINQLNDLVANSILELEAYADGENVTTFTSHQSTAAAAASSLVDSNPVISTAVDSPTSSSFMDDDRQTDELYSKFLNIATAPNNQLILLSNWLNKLKDFKNSNRLTKVFFHAMSAPIEDIYLMNFYNFFKQQINLKFVDYYTNKNFLHQISSANFKKFQTIADNRIKNARSSSIIKLQGIYKEKVNEAQRIKPEENNEQTSGYQQSNNFSRFFLTKSLLVDDSGDTYKDLLTMRDNNSKIPLHYASKFGRYDLLKLLVDNAPENIYAFDNHTMTPLLLAIKHNHLECVKYLLIKENDLAGTALAKDKAALKSLSPGFSPLNYACKYGNYNIIKALLDYDKIIHKEAQNVEGLLPMHMVAISGHYKVIELLVNYGKLNPNCLCSLHNWTPIFYASFHGHSRTTRELIRHGAIPDILDEKFYSPIFYAAYNGHVNVLNTLFHSINFSNSNMPLTIKNLSQSNNLYHIHKNNNDNHSSNISSPNTPTNITNMFKSVSNKLGEDRNAGGNIALSQSSASPQFNQQILSTSVSVPSTELNLLASTTEHLNNGKINFDAIPTLSLPPPIIPLRRYGHNFLEKKTSLQIYFLPGKSSIKLFNYHNNNDRLVNGKFHIAKTADFDSPEDEFDTPLFPGRITITSSSSDVVPRNLLLPINEKDNFVTFQIDELTSNFSMDFELYPTFGTKLIAKTTALSNVFLTNGNFINDDSGVVTLPLFDTRLKNVGKITFKYQIIYSYCGAPLEITKYETYWKSTNNNNEQQQETTQDDVQGSKVTSMLSFVAASSLSGDYLKINICMLNDGTPIICPHNFIEIENGIKLSLLTLSYKELLTIVSKSYKPGEVKRILNELSQEYANSINPQTVLSPLNPEIVSLYKKNFLKKVSNILLNVYLPLDIILECLPKEASINFDIFYPTKFELHNFFKTLSINNSSRDFAKDLSLNSFIDLILTIVFSHIRSLSRSGAEHENVIIGTASNSGDNKKRSIVFSSFNPIVCKVLNWKQPNFPVFFNMGGTSFNYYANNFELNSANGFPLIKSQHNQSQYRNVSRTSVAAVSSTVALLEGAAAATGTGASTVGSLEGAPQTLNSSPNATAVDDEDGEYYSKMKQNSEESCTRSIEDAVRFATTNNLIGLILSIKLLTLIPDLSKTIRSRGLILVGSREDPKSFNNHFMGGNSDQEEQNENDVDLKGISGTIRDFEDIKIKDYFKTNSINGLRTNNILEFQGSIDM